MGEEDINFTTVETDTGPQTECIQFPEDEVWGCDRQTDLEVSALGLQPVVDKTLRISGKTQHELSLGLQLVNGLNGLMDLWSQTQETVNLK